MPTQRRYLVTIAEWLTHEVVIEAETPEAAQLEAERRWGESEDGFKFRDNGIDGITVDELTGP